MGIQRGLEGRCRRGTFQPIVSHASTSSSSSLSTISSCCRLPNSTTSLGPPSADTDSNCAASASIAASPSAHLARTVARTSSSRLSSLKMSSRVNLADPSKCIVGNKLQNALRLILRILPRSAGGKKPFAVVDQQVLNIDVSPLRFLNRSPTTRLICPTPTSRCLTSKAYASAPPFFSLEVSSTATVYDWKRSSAG
ncbi:hypothetical protein OF846_002171 [Rhodotorula toruloides]|nr:hypothetical protein OF846_002171 [Rhodotorula toruloides]